ncbi:beta-secretase 1, partial [Clonorchis sinensis]
QSFSVIGSSPEEMNGLILIGGTNLTGMTQTVDTILYTPVREPWFYEVVLTDLRVEEQSVVEDCKELNVEFSIVDSGTTNIQVPERVFQPLLGHIKTYVAKQSSSTAAMLQNYASFWTGASMLCETSSDNQIGGATGLPYTLFPVIEFQMLALEADVNKKALSLTLSPQQYIRFVGRHPKNGVTRDCFAFGIRPHHSGTILGAVFLEGFFTVFHRDSLKVGFGNSTCNRYSNVSTVTSSMVNGVRAWKSSIGRKTPSECAFYRPVQLRITDKLDGLIHHRLRYCRFVNWIVNLRLHWENHEERKILVLSMAIGRHTSMPMRRTLERLQNPGVQIASDENLTDLEYADDIVLIFEEEEKAQVFLDELTKVIPSFVFRSYGIDFHLRNKMPVKNGKYGFLLL